MDSYCTELHYIELLYCKIKSLCTEVHCKNYGNLKKNNEMRSTECLSQSSVENNCVGVIQKQCTMSIVQNT